MISCIKTVQTTQAMPNEDCTKYELGQATTDYDPVSRKTVA